MEKLYFNLYELKGLIDSMVLLAEHEENYHNPLIDKVEAKMNEIIKVIAEKSA